MFGDDVVCIFLIKNQKAGGRVKRIDAKFFCYIELWNRKQVLPYYVRSEENVADGMTKNQPEKMFKKQTTQLHILLLCKG